MTERWERVARLLKTERLSNGEVGRRLRVRPSFVAEVRADLGLPPFRPPRLMWTQEEFDRMTVAVEGGHRLWTGRKQRDGIPVVADSTSAYRIAFRLHYGRPPVGKVTCACRKKFCVEGGHLRDRVMRTARAEIRAWVRLRRQAAYAREAGGLGGLSELPSGVTWRGIDLVAIRRALRGPKPFPKLLPAERELAARFADPEMTDGELARRLGSRAKSVKKWRTEGGPS